MKRGPLLALLWMTAVRTALAQPASMPEPIVRATIDPPRVVVGQPATLRVELLAPNYMTAPPVFPDLQLHNAVTRALGTINISEQQHGLTYAGMRREFAIHPQEAGSYLIANQQVVVTYAAEPPRSREATLALPRLAFDAFIPDAAQALEPFISASSLRIRQSVERSPGDLKVGDAVVRTVTIEAESIPAMLLPPLNLGAPTGLAAYPDQPSLAEKADARTDVLTATRVERVTYMLEQPGDYLLPGIDIGWWNVRERGIERARTEPIALHVIADPAVSSDGLKPPPSPLRDWRASVATLAAHWPFVVLALGGLGALAWFAPRAVRALRAWHEQRRAAYLQSEAHSFDQVRDVARRGDTAASGWVVGD